MAKRKFNLVEDYQEALWVLDEFVTDVEAIEGDDLHDSVKDSWPDIYVTFLKARKLVRDD